MRFFSPGSQECQLKMHSEESDLPGKKIAANCVYSADSGIICMLHYRVMVFLGTKTILSRPTFGNDFGFSLFRFLVDLKLAIKECFQNIG